MQPTISQTRTGFSLLTDDEIHSLLHPEFGYMSRDCPGLCVKDKKTLVLDVDETILSATSWTNEVCIGDIVQLADDSSEEDCSTWIITALILSSGMDFHETITTQSNQETHLFFAQHIRSDTRVSSVCLSNSEGFNSSRKVPIADLQREFIPCFDSFDKLHSYNLRRPNLTPVSFFCEGFVVRLRPHLSTFLSFACANFHVVIFTAAVKHVYVKLLTYVRRSLASTLGGISLWDQAFFRQDCDVLNRKYLKNITKFGVDLSQIVLIDDKRSSFRGFEPNAIQIAPFYGSSLDDQLLCITPFLRRVASARDVRYPICGIREKRRRGIREIDDNSSSSLSSLSSNLTNRFLDDLWESRQPYKRVSGVRVRNTGLRSLKQKQVFESQQVQPFGLRRVRCLR